MSIESLFDALCNNANSVTRKIYEKRCSLAHETDRDKLNLGAIEYSRLEGMLEGFKVAISEMRKHVGSDTNLPTSAKRSDGEDINVPTTLPACCKVGQWVKTEDGKILKIDCITGDLVSVRSPNGLAYCTSTPDLTFKPVRFREYTFEEAKGLLGKTMEKTEMFRSSTSHYVALIDRVEYHEYDGELYINLFPFKWWAANNATIDGVPIGVPVVDEEAMKEVE